MDANHDQTDHVYRSRLVESFGARDDSPSWNLGSEKQGDTIRVDGTSPRWSRARGREGVRQGGCIRVQQGQVQGQDVGRDAQLADPAAGGWRGKVQDQEKRRECDETSRQR